ncbi:MAG: phage portal protein [Flavobacteriaceae bacterium]
MKLGSWLVEKLNPAQRWIAQEYGDSISTEPERSYIYYYEALEIVNRAVNMVIDDAAEVNYYLGTEKIGFPTVSGIKRKTVETLINVQPNPYQDLHSFRRDLLMDFMLDGNMFIYYDGAHLYHLPANKVIVEPDEETFVKKYVFDGRLDYYPNEVIHVKDNNSQSLYRGASRLRPALRTMKLMKSMRDFQDNFFNNGAVPGLVIHHPDTLSPRIKDRMKEEWRQAYRPQSGGRNPMILDGGMKIDSLSNVSFKDLDFTSSIEVNEKVILKALGVPPVLIDSGNNANLRPNHRLYYLETIIPIIKKLSSAYQTFFGFETYEDVAGIPAMQPELRDEAAYYSTLTNGGIITPDEARMGMGMEALPNGEGSSIRIPQNIAGSAADPSTGGRPAGDTDQ